MSDKQQLHAFVSGRVQGVFFRATTREKARKLGLTGWVKNLRDGRVEVKAEGQKSKLEALESFLHEGPSYARVTKVEANYSTETENFSSFRIAR